MLKSRMFIAITALALSHACKEANDSSNVESLSNIEEMAAGKQLSKNSRCFGANQVNAGIPLPANAIQGANTTEQKAVIMDALSAIPASISFAFFSELEGKIRVVDGIAKECSSRGQATISQDTDIDGCLIMDPQTQELAIMLAPSQKAIHGAMVRAFGQFYMVGGSQSTILNNSINLEEADTATKQFWSNLKSTVLSELQGRPGIDSKLLSEIGAMAPEVFYPEAFDSYYCSADQRAKERAKFPRSIAAFEQEAQSIATLDQALIQTLKTRNTSNLANVNNDQLAPSTRRFAVVLQFLAKRHLEGDYTGEGFNLAKAPYVDYQGGQPIRNVGRFGFNVLRGGANLFRTK